MRTKASTSLAPVPLESLPDDILRGVTQYLPLSSTIRLRQTCRALQHVPLGGLGVSEDHVVRAVEASNLRAVRELLPHAPTPRALAWAAFRGNVAAIDLLLTYCDPSFDSCTALVQAAEAGRADAVRRLVPLCDARANDSRPLRRAAERGHLDVVVLLSPHSDHRAYDSGALRAAASEGHAHVLKFLLAVGESDPRAVNGLALKHAARDGRLEIVQLLLPYYTTAPRSNIASAASDPSTGSSGTGANSYSTSTAHNNSNNNNHSNNSSSNIIISSSAMIARAFRAAIQNGHSDIVKLLAPHYKINGS